MADQPKVPTIFKTLFPKWFGDKSEQGIFTQQRKMWEFLQGMTEVGNGKVDRVTDYEEMTTSPVILSALELVAGDTFTIDENNRTIVLDGDKKILDESYRFLDDFAIEDSLESWAFSTAHYGELPILVKGEKDQGIVDLNSDIHPLDFYRIQSGSLFGFMTPYENDGKGHLKILPPWEMVHIFHKRKPTKTRYDDLKKVKIGDKSVILDSFEVIGYLEAVRGVYKKLRLLEDSLVLARIDRAPLKRVFYIDVGDADPKQKLAIMDEFKRNYKTETGFAKDGYYKSGSNPMAFGQELFIPISEGVKSIETSEYGGDTEVRGIVDIEYLQNQLFGGLKVPPSVLGLTGDLPGSLGESALVRLEIRYARTVKTNRRAVSSGIFRLLQIHNAYKGNAVNRDTLNIQTNYISTAEEEEMRNIMASRVETGSKFIEFLGSIGIKVDEFNEKFAKYAIYDLLKYSTLDWKIIRDVVKSDPEAKEDIKDYVKEQIQRRGMFNDEMYELPIVGEERWRKRTIDSFGRDVFDIDESDLKDIRKSNKSKEEKGRKSD